MKIKRFLSVFLLCACLTGLFLTPAASALDIPDIQAKAALLVDVNTDAVAYAKNIHEKNYPASLTKVMTALLILEKVSGDETLLNTQVTAPESAFSDTYYHADGSTAGIKAGEILTVKELLQCMLIVSANEACNILADWYAGSIPAFVDTMNAKAEELGCADTHFVNPNGLHDPDHYTSAWDLYLITKAAMQYPEFMEICDSAKAVIPATNLSKERSLYTTNHLLSNWRVIGYRDTRAHGIKTGLTLTDYRYRGLVTFVNTEWPTEYMHLFTATGWTGETHPCDEGDLAWIRKADLLALPMWEGDRIFLRLLDSNAPFFSLKLCYAGDRLESAVLNGKAMSL